MSDKEIYQELTAIREQGARTEAHLSAIVDRLDKINGSVGKHDDRLDGQDRELVTLKTVLKIGLPIVGAGLVGANADALRSLFALL